MAVSSKAILQIIKQYLPCSKYTLGYVEEGIEDSLCLYFRSGTMGKFEYDKEHSTIMPLTVVYTGTGNYTDTEQKILDFYNSFVFLTHIDFDEESKISILPANDMMPVFLSKNQAGFYQWAIDINVNIY